MAAVATALIESETVRVKRTRHGLMAYHRHDAFIGRSLDLYGEFSAGETRLFEQIIKPGWTVLDVGANIGVHTLTFSKLVGSAGTVLAFEPQQTVYHMLCGNLALNESKNVRTFQLAVGRNPGHVVVPPIDYSKRGNFGGVELSQGGAGQRVQTITLDSTGLAACHLIKIDVEGMEADALSGATATIKKHRPLLFVENDRIEKSAELIDAIMGMDYTLYWHVSRYFDPDNFFGNAQNAFENLISTNMICLPVERPATIAGLSRISNPDDRPGKIQEPSAASSAVSDSSRS